MRGPAAARRAGRGLPDARGAQPHAHPFSCRPRMPYHSRNARPALTIRSKAPATPLPPGRAALRAAGPRQPPLRPSRRDRAPDTASRPDGRGPPAGAPRRPTLRPRGPGCLQLRTLPPALGSLQRSYRRLRGPPASQPRGWRAASVASAWHRVGAAARRPRAINSLRGGLQTLACMGRRRAARRLPRRLRHRHAGV